MSFIKRLLKVLILSCLILIPFNYFFAHFAFHRVINKFVQAQVPKDQHLTFNSSFHVYPSPLIRIKHLDYKDNQNSEVSIDTFDAKLDMFSLIKTKTLTVDEFTLDGLTIRLLDKHFDELIKNIMFPLIREGLGVPRDPKVVFPSKFLMKNIRLLRLHTNEKTEVFNLLSVTYATESADYMRMCFPSKDKADRFFNQFIRQYLLVAKVEGECIGFTKSLKPLNMPAPSK